MSEAEPQGAEPDEVPRLFARIQSLVHAARAGDRAAIEELFTLHEPMMMRWARRRLGQSLRTLDETRDVLHDAYQVVLRKLDVFELHDSRSFARWLRGIVTRIVLSKARSPHVQRREREVTGGDVQDLDLTPMSRASFDELMAWRYRLLKEFPREDRLVWRLRHRGWTNQRIAEALGITDRAVRMRFAKLDARLRHRLAPILEQLGRGR